MIQTDEKSLITPKELGISNKDIIVKKVCGINVKKFRNMSETHIDLSDRITLISGHNGTMKSTLIGLFVQSFNSDVEDLFGADLKTKFGEIFKLSTIYDKDKYEYDLIIQDNNGLNIKVPVYTKPRSKADPSPRIVTGGNTGKDGNLIYNTNFLNLNRLYSIHTTNSKPYPLTLSEDEQNFVAKFYNIVLQKESYKKMETVSDKQIKKTFAPADSTYNYESISSGEDNLGRIANSLISFMRFSRLKKENQQCFNGIFCIDEMEVSLHPVAQKNLFDFLYKWANQYKVQIIATTHSLPLIRHSIEGENHGKEIKNYYLSTLYTDHIDVIKKPSYENIYKELTFDFNHTKKVEMPKIDILCEDELAKKFIRYMISKQDILNRINFIPFDDTNGFPFTFLTKLCNTASSFVKNTIIVFDADITESDLKKIKKRENILRLPDHSKQLPIEQLFIRYIYNKDKNDEVFLKTLKMPKAAFIKTLTDDNIYITDEDSFKIIESRHFKKWFKNNDWIVKKLFNSFAKSVNGREEFVEELVDKLNKINIRNGYPEIKF
ncbi:AAA family ATPase [Sutcliffiella sp. NC1]|uniref:AAA family ATPase n=1 Tax=Sutcliffiella sp. NC1 TaxID=3004096 RepID=UPI0022DDE049|nr:AAA family ATPase [Sutcliffiella sp. NC1]WBL16399.1 AAA family ATPase [Sutcliffiella sp. NC1]